METSMNHKIKTLKKLAVLSVVAALFCLASVFLTQPVHASTQVPVYYADDKTVIGYLNGSDEIVYKPAANPYYNINYLNYLLEDDNQKTIVFPSGSTIELRHSMKPGSNKTIKATGAAIHVTTPARGAIAPDKPVSNIKVYGGTWRNTGDTAGCTNSMFRFAHANNILIDGCDIAANVEGHSVELIACKYVTLKNSRICATGNYVSTHYEEQVQIDIATPHTSPSVMEVFGKEYVQGQTCSNIYILNNYIKGPRGVCASFAKADTEYINKFHRNIVIQNNVIVGKTGEGVALFNTISATVTGNEIYSFSKQYSSSYSIGLHFSLFGNISKSAIEDKRIIIKSNLIKGGRQAVQVYSQTTSKYGRVYIKYNDLYCKVGASAAIKAPTTCTWYQSLCDNKKHTWIR